MKREPNTQSWCSALDCKHSERAQVFLLNGTVELVSEQSYAGDTILCKMFESNSSEIYFVG